MRKYTLSGDVNEESFKDFCEHISIFETESDDPIELELNSQGGAAIDALAFYSRMRLSRCDINVTVLGMAGSAAVLILAGGDYRRMAKESWLYVHEDESTLKSTNVSDFESHAKHMRRLETQWDILLEDLTGTPADKWAELHKADLFLTPKECVQLGIADEII